MFVHYIQEYEIADMNSFLNAKSVVILLLLCVTAMPQGLFKPERGTLLGYELQESGGTYNLQAKIKTFMPYRSFVYKKISGDTTAGEVSISIFAVKGADRIIFDFSAGEKIYHDAMSLWISRYGYQTLIKENKITLAVEDTIPVLFTVTGKTKSAIKLNGRNKKLNSLILSETDTVKMLPLKGGRVMHIADDPANPMILYYEGKAKLRLKEVKTQK